MCTKWNEKNVTEHRLESNERGIGEWVVGTREGGEGSDRAASDKGRG